MSAPPGRGVRLRLPGPLPWIGAASGVTSGLLGVGGAIVLVPLMTRVLKLTQHRAHGTSLAVVLFTATAAFLGYLRTGNVDVLAALPLVAGSVIGSPLGAHWAHATPAAALRRAFGILLLAVSVRMFLPQLPAGHVLPEHGVAALAARVALGGATGVLSGFFGVGGGVVLVPALVLLAGVPQHVAQGISLLFIVPTAAAGAWTHHKLGNVERSVVLPIALWSMGGAFAAALVAASIPAAALRVLFGVFLVANGARMAFGRRRGPAAAAPDAPPSPPER
jgi:uncharacterized protein